MRCKRARDPGGTRLWKEEEEEHTGLGLGLGLGLKETLTSPYSEYTSGLIGRGIDQISFQFYLEHQLHIRSHSIRVKMKFTVFRRHSSVEPSTHRSVVIL